MRPDSCVSTLKKSPFLAGTHVWNVADLSKKLMSIAIGISRFG